MITDAVVYKLKGVFATKDDITGIVNRLDVLTTVVIDSKQEIRNLREDVDDLKGLKEITQGLVVSVDGMTKSISDLQLEYSAMGMQLTRHEKWHHQTAGKLNLKLEY